MRVTVAMYDMVETGAASLAAAAQLDALCGGSCSVCEAQKNNVVVSAHVAVESSELDDLEDDFRIAASTPCPCPEISPLTAYLDLRQEESATGPLRAMQVELAVRHKYGQLLRLQTLLKTEGEAAESTVDEYFFHISQLAHQLRPRSGRPAPARAGPQLVRASTSSSTTMTELLEEVIAMQEAEAAADEPSEDAHSLWTDIRRLAPRIEELRCAKVCADVEVELATSIFRRAVTRHLGVSRGAIRREGELLRCGVCATTVLCSFESLKAFALLDEGDPRLSSSSSSTMTDRGHAGAITRSTAAFTALRSSAVYLHSLLPVVGRSSECAASVEEWALTWSTSCLDSRPFFLKQALTSSPMAPPDRPAGNTGEESKEGKEEEEKKRGEGEGEEKEREVEGQGQGEVFSQVTRLLAAAIKTYTELFGPNSILAANVFVVKAHVARYFGQ